MTLAVEVAVGEDRSGEEGIADSLEGALEEEEDTAGNPAVDTDHCCSFDCCSSRLLVLDAPCRRWGMRSTCWPPCQCRYLSRLVPSIGEKNSATGDGNYWGQRGRSLSENQAGRRRIEIHWDSALPPMVGQDNEKNGNPQRTRVPGSSLICIYYFSARHDAVHVTLFT